MKRENPVATYVQGWEKQSFKVSAEAETAASDLFLPLNPNRWKTRTTEMRKSDLLSATLFSPLFPSLNNLQFPDFALLFFPSDTKSYSQ